MFEVFKQVFGVRSRLTVENSPEYPKVEQFPEYQKYWWRVPQQKQVKRVIRECERQDWNWLWWWRWTRHLWIKKIEISDENRRKFCFNLRKHGINAWSYNKKAEQEKINSEKRLFSRRVNAELEKLKKEECFIQNWLIFMVSIDL